MEIGSLVFDCDNACRVARGDDVKPWVVVAGRGQPSDARWDFCVNVAGRVGGVGDPVYLLGWLVSFVVCYKLFCTPQGRLMCGVEFFMVIIALLVLGGLIWLLFFCASEILAWFGFLLP